MSLSVGVIGAGKRGAFRASLVAAMDGASLAGIADADSLRANAVARDLGCPAFGSTPALFDVSNVIFICASTRDHYVIAREATRLGKHVFLEWPPATSIREVDTLVRMADEAGTHVAVSCPLLYHPSWAEWAPNLHPSILHLDFSYGSQHTREIVWPHEIAECIAIVTRMAGSLSVRHIDARSSRTPEPVISALAFTLQIENGALVQAFLHHGPGPSERRITLAGRGTVVPMVLDTLETDNKTTIPGRISINDLLALEQQAFLNPQPDEPVPSFALAEARYVVKLVERILAKLR